MRFPHLSGWPALAVLVAILVAGALAAQSAAGRSVLRHAGLQHDPQRYTELYFERAGRLPPEANAGAILKPAFEIGNREGGARRYRWTVSERTERGHAVRSLRGTTPVAAGDTRRVAPSLRLSCPGSRARIEVRLSSPRESIGYWVKCVPVPGGSPGG